MSDERVRAVGDLEESYKKVNEQFEKSKKNVSELTTEYNTLAASQKVVLDGAQAYKDVLKLSGDPKTIKGLKEQQQIHKTIAEQVKKEESIKRQLIETDKKIIQKQKEEELLKQRKLRTTAQIEAATKRETAAKEKANKAAAKAKQVILDEANAYKVLVKQTDKAQNEFKQLAAQHGRTSTEALKAKKKFDALDRSLRRINEEARDGRRDVGRYATAWRGAQSALGAVGVSIGIGFAVREGIDVLTEFDESAADMAKTLNITQDAAKALSMELINIDTRTSIDELQKISAIGGQMGMSANEVVGFTESIDKLNVALGDEFTGGAEEITREIGGLRNVLTDFKTDDAAADILKIGNALNVLGAAGNATSPVVTDFAKRISGIGVPLGLTTAQILGTSTALQELGVNSEKGGTAVGKILQKMTTDVKGFAKLAGKPVDEFTKMLNDDMFGAFQEVLKGSKQFEGDSVGLGKKLEELGLTGSGTSEVFLKLGGNIDLMTEKTNLSAEALKNTESVTAEFNTKNDTLSATIEKSINKIKAQILAFNSSTGVADKLKNAIKFLTDNMGVIITVGGKVLRFFLIYKTVMKANQILTGKFGTSLKGLVKGFKNLVGGGKRAIVTLKGIGKALKGIGFGIALELLIESAAALYDIATGAKKAREALESLERANENAAKNVERIVNRQSELFNKRMKDLDLEIRTRIANGEDEKKLAEERLVREKQITEETINNLKKTKKFKDEALSQVLTDENRLRELEESGKLNDNLEEYNRLVDKYATKTGFRGEASKLITEKINRLTAENVALSESIGEFNDKLAEKEVEIIEGGGGGGGGGPKEKEKLSLLEAIEDAENDLINNDERRSRERLDIEAMRDIEKKENSNANVDEINEYRRLRLLQLMRDLNEIETEAADKRAEKEKERLERDAKRLKEVAESVPFNTPEPEAEDFGLGIEEDFKDKRLELLLDQSKSEKEIAKELSEFRIDLLEREIAIRENLGLESTDFQIELAELQRQKETESREKWLEAGKQVLDNLGEAAKRYADSRIADQQKVIDSEQALLNALNASADLSQESTESIAAQQEKVNAAQAEKIRLEKEKQAIEFATAAITTFTNALEAGKTVPQAFGDVALSTAGLELVLSQLPKFFHGTEDTGTGGGGLSDQYGAITGVTHKKERVINEKDNDKLKGMSNKSVVDGALKYYEMQDTPKIESGAYMQMLMHPEINMPVLDDDRMVKEIGSLKSEMQNVKKAIENQVFPESQTGRMFADFMTMIDKDANGNITEYLIRNLGNK